MAEADDWEREYQEDLRRMAEGRSVETHGVRQVDEPADADVPAEENGPTSVPQVASGAPPPPSGTQEPQPYAQYADVEPVRRRAEEQETTPSYLDRYVNGDADGGTIDAYAAATYHKNAYPKDEEWVIDPRYKLPFVRLPPSFSALFGQKIGRSLYFVDVVDVLFKAFWSPDVVQMALFVTPMFMYFGDLSTGEIVIGRNIYTISELLAVGENGISLRSTANLQRELFFRLPGGREQLMEVLKKLYTASGKSLKVSTFSEDFEKRHLKQIKLFKPEEWQWTVEEDPRTGLPLVDIPDKHIEAYAPLVPKIMHWFGGVNHLLKEWRGVSPNRRGCWITATTLYLSLPGGPKRDGRDITRSIGIEYIGAALNGKGGNLGIIMAAGPKQPHLALQFDSLEVKERVLFVLRCCFYYRMHRPLLVRVSNSIETDLVIESEKNPRVELFVMRTRDDLYGLLRSPAARSKK